MSTKSPQKPTSYQWELLLPQNAFRILVQQTKVPFIIGLLALSVLGIVFGSIRTVRWLKQNLPQVKSIVVQSVEEIYPDGLVVTVKDGVLSTNSQKQVVIPYPQQLKKWIKNDYSRYNLPPNFIIIDPSSAIEDFENYQTLVLVSARSVTYYRNTSEKQKEFHTFEPDVNFTLNKSALMLGLRTELDKIPFENITSMLSIIVPVFMTVFGVYMVIIATLFTMISVWVLMKSSSLHFKFWPLFLFTFAVTFLIRLIGELTRIAALSTLMNYEHILSRFMMLSFAYVGLQQAKNHKKMLDVSQLVLMGALHPWYAAKDLIDSKRDGLKKLCLGIMLFIFVVMPWINFFIQTLRILTGTRAI